jgi:ArsR family transcriptional regulator, arsenate/arsenite/antimonite-responsive transcriptional repressor
MGRVPRALPVLQSPQAVDACCDPLGVAPLDADQARELASRLKAVADPARLRLLSLLMASEGREACTCDLTAPLGLSQPTVSHHLKRLAEAGLVVGERRGVWTSYRVVPEALQGLAEVLLPQP